MTDSAEEPIFEYPEGCEETYWCCLGPIGEGGARIYEMTVQDDLNKTADEHLFSLVYDTTEASRLYEMTFDTSGDPTFETFVRKPLLERIIHEIIAGSMTVDVVVEYQDDLSDGYGEYWIKATLNFESDDDRTLVRLMLGNPVE